MRELGWLSVMLSAIYLSISHLSDTGSVRQLIQSGQQLKSIKTMKAHNAKFSIILVVLETQCYKQVVHDY